MDPKISIPVLKPITIPTRQRIAGFAASYARPGEQVAVEVMGIHAFDEGLAFYKRLAVFNQYAEAIGRRPGAVDRMLVVIGERETNIYADDGLPLCGEIRPKRSVKAGEAVFTDDIACVRRIDIPGLELKEPAGLLLLESFGWRRGICYDFRAIGPKDRVDIQEAYATFQTLGGMLMSHLMFTERFLLEADDWDKVIAAGWFPFVSFSVATWESLIQAIQNNGDVNAVEEQIHKNLTEQLSGRLQFWAGSEVMRPHMEFLNRAVDAYKNGDWVSCASLAVPRIEGLMRQAFSLWGKYRELIDGFAEAVKLQEHSRSLLFPDRLGQYFRTILFPFVDFQGTNLPSTRHTLSHGLVNAERITRKQALTTLLLIDHLAYCLPVKQQSTLVDLPSLSPISTLP